MPAPRPPTRAPRHTRRRRLAAAPKEATKAAAQRGPRRAAGPLTVEGFQAGIEGIYGQRDRARGMATTFMWFAEEVGELSRALRRRGRKNLAEEFADVFAWLVTLASMAGIDLARASQKYADGCPRCGSAPCRCPHARTSRA